MKNQIILLTLTLIIFSGLSCRKGKLEGEYYLSEEMKSEIPFKGHEIVRFQEDTNNLINLTGEYRVDSIIKRYTDHTESDYIFCESDITRFSNENYRMDYIMEACLVYPKGVSFNFVYKNGNYKFSSSYKQFSDTHNFIDSIIVNEEWLTGIYVDTMKYVYENPFPVDLQKYPVKSYYSKNLGVVKIIFSDNTHWELRKIDW